MKGEVKGARLLIRLGLTAAAVLLSQQVLAVGTDAGTTVGNQATVAYDVNGNTQTPIESDPNGNSTPGAGNPTEFLVDRRVDFTLVETSGGPTTPVAPGDSDVIASFTLTNASNAVMDFRLDVADFAGNVFGTLVDDTDLTNYRIRVANGDGAGGTPDLATDLAFVDELAEDGVVEIFVFADAPGTVSNGQHANIQLTATAADEAAATATPGTLDADLAESPGADVATVIESVFADGGNDGLEQAEDSYEIVSASLTIKKTSAVISDPFGSGKAVPDAVIEYTISIDNSSGGSPAQSVVVTDNIQIPDVLFEDEAYGAGQDVTIDGAFCNADAGDADTDGCSYDGGTGALSIAVPDIAAGATTTITYQVRINTT
jgi:hypothetical protein